MLRIIGTIFVSLFLAACAAAGYFPTNDPRQKITDAHYLISQGRPLMAELFLQEATALLAQKPDTLTEAELNFALARLYRSEAYHRQRATFIENGTYDPTYRRSIDYSQKAITLFDSVDSDLGVAKSMWELGKAQSLGGDKAAGCDTWRSALVAYNEGVESGRITTGVQVINSDLKTVGEFVMRDICTSCMDLQAASNAACFAEFDKD